MRLIMKKYQPAGMFRVIFVLTVILVFTLFFIRCTGQEEAAGEKLIGFTFNYEKNEVALTVITTGCTGKSDFSFNVQGKMITVLRKKKDECKAMPEAVIFTYSLKEAGLDANKEYTVNNFFIANPNLAGIR